MDAQKTKNQIEEQNVSFKAHFLDVIVEPIQEIEKRRYISKCMDQSQGEKE